MKRLDKRKSSRVSGDGAGEGIWEVDKSDKVRLGFIQVELATAKSFAQLALTEYQFGNRILGDALREKVAQAYEEAMKWIDRAEESGIKVAAERRQAATVRGLFYGSPPDPK
jgi:hypothetical protein